MPSEERNGTNDTDRDCAIYTVPTALVAIAASLCWLGPAALGLVIAMLVAIPVANHRQRRHHSQDRVYRRLYVWALAWQALHCAEEWATGFPARWPAQFGYPAWSATQFLSFNAVFYLLFAAAPFAPRALAWFASFFSVAMFANGLGHVAIAAWLDGYFPGLITAPGSLVFGILLLRRPARNEASHPFSRS